MNASQIPATHPEGPTVLIIGAGTGGMALAHGLPRPPEPRWK
jgi:cation diffusion facilitator CzcD-associated flavoprotein CzcO